MIIVPASDSRRESAPVENPPTPPRNPSALPGELQRRRHPIEDVPPPPLDLVPLNCVNGFISLPQAFRTWKLKASEWVVAAYMSEGMGVSGHPCTWEFGSSIKDYARAVASKVGLKLRTVELALERFVRRRAITFTTRLWRDKSAVFAWINWALRPFTPVAEPHRPHPALRLPGVPGAGPCAGAVPADPIFDVEGAGSCAPDAPGAAICAASAAPGADSCAAFAPGADSCAPQIALIQALATESGPDAGAEGARPDVNVKAFEEELTSTSVRAPDPDPKPPARPLEGWSTESLLATASIPSFRTKPQIVSPMIRELIARGHPLDAALRKIPLVDPEPAAPATPPVPVVRHAPPPADPRLAPKPTVDQELARLEGCGDLGEAERLAVLCAEAIGDSMSVSASANFHRRNMRLLVQVEAAKRLPAKVILDALKAFRKRTAENPRKAFVGMVNSWLDEHGLRSPHARPNRPTRPERRAAQPSPLAISLADSLRP